MYFFDSILSPYLSGFRKSHSCQGVLMHFVETCKSQLDDKQVCAALLTDLSKAFDCLPHRLLLAKLHAYGVDKKACTLIMSYFKDRKQRVKLMDSRSEWLPLVKGAPQGSLFGSFMYNVFSNDFLCLIVESCFGDIFNYADDNSVLSCGKKLCRSRI